MATVTPIEPTEAAAPPPKPQKAKRQRKDSRQKPAEGETPPPDPQFFTKVASVPAEDWGQRAFIYCYVTGPVCDLRTEGRYGYLFRSSAPILDLQKLMEDYGSFKGYLTLNRRKPGEEKGELIDRYDFEIYNPKYPPKIPRAAWKDDPRNEKWAALLPPEPDKNAPAAQQQPSMLETLKVLNEVRRDARQEAESHQPDVVEQPDPVQQLAGIATVLQTLMPKKEGSSELVQVMTLQLTMLQAQLADARKESIELQRELRAPKAADPLTEKLLNRAVEKLFEEPKDDEPGVIGTGGPRSRMSGTQELVAAIAGAAMSSPALAHVARGFEFWMMQNAQKPAQGSQPAPPVAPPPAIAPPSDAARPNPSPGLNQQAQPAQPAAATPVGRFTPQQMAPFIGEIMGPLMVHMEDPTRDGYDLQQWFIDGKGQMAYNVVRNQGVETIMQAFQLSPYWGPNQQTGFGGMAQFEPQLRQMITEFCSDPPPEPEEEDEDEPADNEAEDLTEPEDLTGGI